MVAQWAQKKRSSQVVIFIEQRNFYHPQTFAGDPIYSLPFPKGGWRECKYSCRKAQKKRSSNELLFFVPRTRLELARANAHYPLKVACLPISPPGPLHHRQATDAVLPKRCANIGTIFQTANFSLKKIAFAHNFYLKPHLPSPKITIFLVFITIFQ